VRRAGCWLVGRSVAAAEGTDAGRAAATKQGAREHRLRPRRQLPVAQLGSSQQIWSRRAAESPARPPARPPPSTRAPEELPVGAARAQYFERPAVDTRRPPRCIAPRPAAPAIPQRPPHYSPPNMSNDQLGRLPAEVLELIACRLGDVRDVLQLRLAARYLRRPGALAVRHLHARRGALPPRAWEVFPNAVCLTIAWCPLEYAELPHRLEGIVILGDENDYGASTDVTNPLRQLLLHPCAPRLKRLTLRAAHVAAEAARALLSALPSLERCVLEVDADVSDASAAVQISSFPQHLQQLSLSTRPGDRIRFDATGLPSSLTSLELQLGGDGFQLANMATAMAACPQLQRLSLDMDLKEPGWAIITAAWQHLKQLRSLSLPRTMVLSSDWDQLAGSLPGLQELDVEWLQLPAWSSDAPSLTSLRGHLEFKQIDGSGYSEDSSGSSGGGGDDGAGDGDDINGRLVKLLPALRQLHALCHSDISALATVPRALQGHPQLAELCLDASDEESCGGQHVEWPQQQSVLGSLPQLRRLLVKGVPCGTLDDLLADAAGCPQLEELEVMGCWCDGDCRKHALTGAGLAALAEGACRGSLRSVVLDTQLGPMGFSCADNPFAEPAAMNGCFSVASAAPLLRPGVLPRLQRLQLDVALPPAGDGEQAVEGGQPRAEVQGSAVRRVTEQLEGLGAAVPAEGRFGCRFVSVGIFEEHVLGVILEGSVFDSVPVQLNVWLSREDREAFGLLALHSGDEQQDDTDNSC
jgi:hypothetical protein